MAFNVGLWISNQMEAFVDKSWDLMDKALDNADTRPAVLLNCANWLNWIKLIVFDSIMDRLAKVDW